MEKINLKIITPQKIIHDGLVDIVTVKTISGYLGILKDHIPLVSTIVPSKLKYREDERDFELYIQGGILQVSQNFVKILSDKAQTPEERRISLNNPKKNK